MIFVSFYTVDTPYEPIIKARLLPSLKKWNLDYDIEPIKDLGGWRKNTDYKPTHLLKMLQKHKQDICFLDADATIEKYPTLLFNIPEEYNIAVHLLDWWKFWRKQEGDGHTELLSGTMVWKYNSQAIELLYKYIQGCVQKHTCLEQKVLSQILEINPQYKIYDLPPEYCCIINRDGSIPEHYVKEPIILHHQASRKHKTKG